MSDLPPSEGFRSLLAAHVVTSGWSLHTGTIPKTPARVIVFTDTGGLEPNPRWLLDFPTVQVMVRGNVGQYLEAYKEAKAIKDVLLGLPSQDLNGDRWVSITMMSDVAYIGRDENERPQFSINFRLIIEPQQVAASNRLAL